MAKRKPQKTADGTPMNSIYCGHCGHFLANEAMSEGRVDFKCRACGYISILARGGQYEEQVVKVYPKNAKPSIKKSPS